MLNKLKKVSYVLLAIFILCGQMVMPDYEVKAKTLRDLKNELAEKQEEYNQSEEAKKLTEAEINYVNQRIGDIMEEKAEIERTIATLNEEIIVLNEDIAKKNEEIINILDYYQITETGEAAYLEYIFKSTSFSDFIYRVAVAEQLNEYNTELIDEYNELIIQKENKKEELNQKTIELNQKQEELEGYLIQLGSNLKGYTDAMIDAEDEIKVLEEYIEVYESKYHCQDDDDLDECTREKLPPGTAFYRPVDAGTITADFGWYSPWGELIGHSGTDYGGMAHGSNVYAIANGKVAGMFYRNSCGGNILFIHHYVGGQTYTSIYGHLAGFNVNVGDVVTPDTVIGWVGGNPSIEYWDGCSTGTHLHLQVAYGLYLEDYTAWSTLTAKSFDSRLIVNTPPLYSWFSDRQTKY